MSIQPVLPSARLPHDPEPFVDAGTAAAFLGITRRTLLQKARSGRVPGHPLDGAAKRKEWRFKLSELDRFMIAPVNSFQQPT